ncbi:dTDP-4-dehydrorhamnose reductase [Phytoactinopolyspora mesophila]|uniref:dTDP-4-dehydrorhamnose reductase n=1 Tax=Phytoactinopolyspora mesophila TaxID=2650750 RepID=A0A7K3MCU5_9ACTN|nr:dTDP-4-dehydrorhamnose reductase [Phytoactinopolyspora mesophila]NDL61141.1 dTDP-4-dehydrorhamnose reductase [Phytoactinopolyspora mesophila]
MLSILVTGGSGQLGRDLRALSSPEADVRAPGSAELDVLDTRAVTEAISELSRAAVRANRQPLLINAAAYTAVDAAETDQERAYAVNAAGPRILAFACARYGVPMVHISTDYVFAGHARRPYRPEETRAARNVYGRSKAAGEDEVLIENNRSWVVRTSWLYGAGGANFVRTMIELERERETVSVVDDQHGSPTWTADLASGLLELGQIIADGHPPRQRVLHCSGTGATTWYRFARAIFAEIGADPERVRPCATADFPRPAPRPTYSVLSNDAWRTAGLTPLRAWRSALHDFFAASGYGLSADPSAEQSPVMGR